MQKNELGNIRKKNKIKKTSKLLLSLLVLLAILSLFWNFRNVITHIFNGIFVEYREMKRGAKFPRQLNGRVPVKLENFDGNLLLTSENEVAVYSTSNAAERFRAVHSAQDGDMRHSGRRMITYTYVSGNINIYDRFAITHRTPNKKVIYDIEVADDGKIAILGSSPHYASNVKVLDSENKQIFEWNLAENYALTAAFSKNSQNIAVVALGSSGGAPRSGVRVFELASSKLKYSFDTEDTIYHLSYISSDRIILITDSNAYFLNPKSGLIEKFPFNGEKLEKFACNDESVVLCFEGYSIDNSWNVVALDSSGQKLGTSRINGSEIKSLKCSKEHIGILSDKNIFLFNKQLKRIKTYNCNVPIYDFVCIGNDMFIVDARELCKIKL
ncbi:MAG: DUF5711 family protein [Oscillospiraceae bacterium]|jgi:hypothetical protein|nr:DUF5711 family protein [Oscillospiraceae bacterium]